MFVIRGRMDERDRLAFVNSAARQVDEVMCVRCISQMTKVCIR